MQTVPKAKDYVFRTIGEALTVGRCVLLVREVGAQSWGQEPPRLLEYKSRGHALPTNLDEITRAYPQDILTVKPIQIRYGCRPRIGEHESWHLCPNAPAAALARAVEEGDLQIDQLYALTRFGRMRTEMKSRWLWKTCHTTPVYVAHSQDSDDYEIVLFANAGNERLQRLQRSWLREYEHELDFVQNEDYHRAMAAKRLVSEFAPEMYTYEARFLENEMISPAWKLSHGADLSWQEIIRLHQ